jgi:hypothetical protein
VTAHGRLVRASLPFPSYAGTVVSDLASRAWTTYSELKSVMMGLVEPLPRLLPRDVFSAGAVASRWGNPEKGLRFQIEWL